MIFKRNFKLWNPLQERRKGELLAYKYSDCAGIVDDRKSTSRYAFLSSAGAVSWSSKNSQY